MTDPHLFSGVGNAYSDEILHRARLSPFKQTRQLTETEAERLHAATVETLVEWTKKLQEEAEGKFPEKVTAFHDGMAVHGRFGKPCPRCATPVQRIVHGEHEAKYCPTWQTEGAARLSCAVKLEGGLAEDRSMSRSGSDSGPAKARTCGCVRLEADRQAERRANCLDIRIAIGTRIPAFERGITSSAATACSRRLTCTATPPPLCRKLIESGASRGRRDPASDTPMSNCRKNEAGASSIHTATQARPSQPAPRIVPSLRDVEQPLARNPGQGRP